MTQFPVATDVLVAPRDELFAMQLELTNGTETGVGMDPFTARALALCIDADAVFVALLAGAHPLEPADVIITRYRRRWRGRFVRWGIVGPFVFVGLLLLVVVLVTLVTAFIWRS